MRSDIIISVVTATYNRAHSIRELYNSLVAQTDKRFKWIVIDDGSTDNTKEIFDEFKQDSFPISYIHRSNGGKHRAINYAMNLVETPLVFIVDSDDKLTEDSIEIIISKYDDHCGEIDICGLSFLRGTPSGGLLCDGKVPIDGMKDSFINCRLKGKLGGDMAEVWYSDVVRQYPFPEYEGEKFIGEDVSWIRMSEKYNMYFYNDVIYISQYMDDGLTKNRRTNNINSPKGCTERAKVILNANIGVKNNIKAMIQYIVYGRLAEYNIGLLFADSPRKVLFCILFIPSIPLYIKWKKGNYNG